MVDADFLAECCSAAFSAVALVGLLVASETLEGDLAVVVLVVAVAASAAAAQVEAGNDHID